MTDETLWLDTMLGREEAGEVHRAVTAATSLAAGGLKIAPSALLDQAIDATVAKVLHLDLIALLADGWVLAKDIRSYGDAKLHPAGTTAVLTLGKHKIERDIKPVITIDIGVAQKVPVDLAIGVAGTFSGVKISIRDAKIVAVGSGSCDIAVKVELAKKEVVAKTIADWTLPGAHTFKEPIAIPLVSRTSR